MRFNEFLARILYQPSPPLVSMDDYLAKKITKEEFDQKTELWWKNPDREPTPEAVQEAASCAKDQVGFNSHQTAFSALAEVMDVCVAEEIPLRGYGQAGSNAKKHPRIISLVKSHEEARSHLALAAAQTLVWMEDCRKLCHDANLRTQIQKRVVAATLMLIAGQKSIYTASELSVQAQLGASLKDRDVFVLGSVAAIVEIVAKHAKELPRTSGTIAACRQLLDAPHEIFVSKRLNSSVAQLKKFVNSD
jgi:hypothetical protein